MTALTLYYHPLSSYCHKVLIAIDVLGIDLDKRLLDLGEPTERAAYLALWPTGKMPLLVDEDRPVPLVAHIAQDGEQMIEIVPVDRADIVEAKLLEEGAAGPEAPGELLGELCLVADEARQPAGDALAECAEASVGGS